MKLSAISNYLTQTEAALLAVLAEKIMRQAERSQAQDEKDEQAYEAVEAAYALRCVAEQSILTNDGQLFYWIKQVKESKALAEWLDLQDLAFLEGTQKEPEAVS